MMLQVHQLDAGYAPTVVCRNLDLATKEGSLTCLLGANGCGKTTLLKTLLGLIPKLGGSVEIGGVAIDKLSTRERARRLAYVPQSAASQFPYTVLDMVTMGRATYIEWFASPSRRDRLIAEAALERLAIHRLASRPFNLISGGERQLVLIARALAQEATMLILDELTSSLDFGNQVRVLAVLRELSSKDLSVLFSTHEPSHAFAGVDCAIFMKDGGLLTIGVPEDVITSQNMKALYGIDVSIGLVTEAGRYVCVPRLN